MTYSTSFGGFARSISLRSHGTPLASILAHCAAVRRMERCSRRSSGGVGGLPRPRFWSSMVWSVGELSNHNKTLAMPHLLNHNKCTDKRNGADEMQAIKTDDSVNTCDCCGRTDLRFTVLMSNGAHYGSVCATKHAGKSSKELAAEMNADEAARIEAAKSEYRAHPAYAALLAKMAQRPRTLLGKPAADFIRAESDAEMAARCSIAAKHGIRPFQL